MIMLFIFFLLVATIVLVFGGRDGSNGSGPGSIVTGNGPAGYNWYSLDDVSINGVRDTTLDGLQDLADWYKEKTGEDLLVTSGTDGDMHAAADRGSHYSGDKLDVASDALENPEFRAQFIAYAESQGIVVLDEYANPSKNSTGGHLDLNFQYYKGNGRFVGITKDNAGSFYPQ